MLHELNLTPKKGFFKQLELLTLAMAAIFIYGAMDQPEYLEYFCVHALVALACILLINFVGVWYTRVQYKKHRIKRSDVLDPLL